MSHSYKKISVPDLKVFMATFRCSVAGTLKSQNCDEESPAFASVETNM